MPDDLRTPKALLTACLEGRTPATTPLSIYAEATDACPERWKPLLDRGLALCRHCPTIRTVLHGVEEAIEERAEGRRRTRVRTLKTPVGSVREVHVNEWHTEYLIKRPEDYRTLQWIVEHAEIVPDYGAFATAEEEMGESGVVVAVGSWFDRTPAMLLNVLWADTTQFCMDLATEVPELFALYRAVQARFVEATRVMAAGPGRYVKWWEVLNIGMLGPRRYRDLLLPIYDEAVPILAQGGKRVMVNYDGPLAAIATQVASAPVPIIEAVTEPPEGDLPFDACRAAWADKVIWGMLNLECFALEPDHLREEIIAKCERAGKRAFALELADELPPNWESALPVVLEALREME